MLRSFFLSYYRRAERLGEHLKVYVGVASGPPPHGSTMHSWHRTYGICDALPISTSPTQIATLTSPQTTQKGLAMFLIGILFLGLWIAGEATAKTMGGFIHVLLILSLTVLVSQMIRGQRDSRLAELTSSSDKQDSGR
jgi:hypothetical protein